MKFSTLLWLFPAVVFIHNTEEAIWLPAWSQQAGPIYPPVEAAAFRFAAALLVALAIALTAAASRAGRQSTAMYLVFGYACAMLANVLIPHLALSLYLSQFMPGLFTALALNLPVLSLLVHRALKEGYVSGRRAVLYAIAVSLALAASIRPLLWLGGVVMKAH